MNEIQPITSSYIEVSPKIKFSDFVKQEKPYTLSLRNDRFLIIVYLDTDGTNQFPAIQVFCNATGGTFNVSIKGKAYRYIDICNPVIKSAFGIKLIDINGHNLFTPWAVIKDGYYEIGFSVNPNYITLNGISF